jgi:hypothetical protein
LLEKSIVLKAGVVCDAHSYLLKFTIKLGDDLSWAGLNWDYS